MERARWYATQPVRFAELLHRSAKKALDHDFLTVAQATAYAAILTLFPGLILAAALVGLLPYSQPWRMQLALFFERVLPTTVSPLLDTYFSTTHRTAQSTQAMIGSILVSITGATSVMTTLMEGFRRAYDLPETGVWVVRRRALSLVARSIVPFAVASAIVVFGNIFTLWFTSHLSLPIRGPVLFLALLVRWSVALAGCVGILAVVYRMGTPMEWRHKDLGTQPWNRVIPGASMATLVWFITTLIFGWYVTRYANYARVYGSLGTAIALMIWLYIVALCVLFGAEFNAQLQHWLHPDTGEIPEVPGKMAETPERQV